MARSTAAQRARLPKSDFACPARAPGSGSYPINKPRRVSSAKGYYRRPYTAKCKGGKTRICRRAKRFGMMAKDYKGSADWRRWCR